MITVDFGLKTAVFGENHSFPADLSSETAKTTFPSQPSTGQHQTLKSMNFSVQQKTNWIHNTNKRVYLVSQDHLPKKVSPIFVLFT